MEILFTKKIFTNNFLSVGCKFKKTQKFELHLQFSMSFPNLHTYSHIQSGHL